MEPTLSFEHLMLPAELSSESFEHGVEFDAILPDYLPDLSRVVRCTLEPRILGRQWLGDSMELDGEVLVHLLYFSEESQNLACYEAPVGFSKSVDCHVSASSVIADVVARVDYCHCRVVNRRKAEIRGAVSCAVHLFGAKEAELLTGASDCGLQCHEKTCKTAVLQACVSQQSEEQAQFLLEGPMEELQHILDLRGVCVINDQRAADGQLFVRGTIRAQLLGQSDSGALLSCSKEIPFSRVLEEDQIADGLPAVVTADLLRLEAALPEHPEEQPLLGLTAEILLNAAQPAEKQLTLLDDCYSTEYEISSAVSDQQLLVLSEMISETGTVSDHISWEEGHPGTVAAVFGSLDRVTVTPKFGDLLLQGNLIYTVYYTQEDGNASVLERSVPFEIVRKLAADEKEVSFQGSLILTGVSVESADADGLEIRASMQLSGAVYGLASCRAVTDISLSEGTPALPEKPTGVILYFGNQGEEIWQIGKRYHLSADRIMEENQLEDGILREKQLLLIPTL